ncbi:MAG TPA: metal ABC transporter ATP-binding protein [Methanoregula sp.]|nr:metal ABC transporter ATP-binding protein [Methanoregula sp.]
MPVTLQDNQQVCLTLDRVWFAYGTNTVLEDVSLSIQQEELVGIAGPNGSGKSTLMKIMVGLLRPGRGTISFSCHIDECEGMTPCRPCIGYVPQNPVIRQEQFPITAREVVEMGTFGQIGLFRRMDAGSRKAVDNAIAEAGLGRVQHELFSDLSGGQQQRTLIARALVGRPHIIALDEPTNGVDAQSKQEFYQLISHLNREHRITVLMILHDLPDLAAHVERVIFLQRKVVYDGPSANLNAEGLWNLMLKAGRSI